MINKDEENIDVLIHNDFLEREQIIQIIWEKFESLEKLIEIKQIEAAALITGTILEYLTWLLQPELTKMQVSRDRKKIWTLYFISSEKNKFILLMDELYKLRNHAAHSLMTQNEKEFFLHKIPEIEELIKIIINQTYSNKLNQIDLVISPNNSILNYCIKYIKISKFQCIKEIEEVFPVDAQFIVFTGDNGDGKTSILQAIAIGIYGNIDQSTRQILCSDKDFETIIIIKEKSVDLFSYCTYLNSYSTISQFAAYSASRLLLQSPESMQEASNKRSPVYNLFKNEGTLYNIEYWFKQMILEKQVTKYEKSKEIIETLLPNIDKIVEEKGVKVPLEHISAGHKSIIAMIGDMMIRLFDSQPEVDDPIDLQGVVLIDEIEAHLHPRWQREFPKLLSKIFPKVQFIITTHSPIPLLGVPSNSIFFKVERDIERGTYIQKIDIDIDNLLPEHLLTSMFFGLNQENIISVNNTDIKRLETQSIENIIQNKNISKQLKELTKDFQIPDFMK